MSDGDLAVGDFRGDSFGRIPRVTNNGGRGRGIGGGDFGAETGHQKKDHQKTGTEQNGATPMGSRFTRMRTCFHGENPAPRPARLADMGDCCETIDCGHPRFAAIYDRYDYHRATSAHDDTVSRAADQQVVESGVSV